MKNIRLKYVLFPCVVTLSVYAWLYSESLFTSFSSDSNSSSYQYSSTVRETRRFKNVIVHLDLKGAPPKVEYLEKFFEFLSTFLVDGVLIEYEDMFPYTDELAETIRNIHYSKEDIARINMAAKRNNLEVIPLIQTFGHLEFVLSQPSFQYLSEDNSDFNTLCISEERGIELIAKMLKQMRELHPESKRIHIGADEAYHIAEDQRCHLRMNTTRITKSKMKLEHIANVGRLAKEAGFQTVFAWNDMFDKDTEDEIKGSGIHKYILPVVWGYASDVTKPGYFPDGLLDRIYNTFDTFYLASAFKGANGIRQPFSLISRYLENHRSYNHFMDLNSNAASKLSGIFITGWSRFSHNEKMCELLPVSIPSLVADLIYINYQFDTDEKIWDKLKEDLKCRPPPFLSKSMSEWGLVGCQFPGIEIYEKIMRDWRRAIIRKHDELIKHVVDKEGKEMAAKVLEELPEVLKPVLFKEDIDELVAQYSQDYETLKDTDKIIR